jgi:DNA primase
MNDKHDLVAVLRHYGTRVPEVRRWSSIKCVIHNDKQASATISPDREMFFCHACDFGGDVYELIMKMEGVGFKDAVNRAETLTNGSRRELSHKFKQGDNLLPRIKGDNKRSGRFIPSRHSY